MNKYQRQRSKEIKALVRGWLYEGVLSYKEARRMWSWGHMRRADYE